jgi:hypothetical protein
MNVPFDMLRRENVLDFIAYGFWSVLLPLPLHVGYIYGCT